VDPLLSAAWVYVAPSSRPRERTRDRLRARRRRTAAGCSCMAPPRTAVCGVRIPDLLSEIDEYYASTRRYALTAPRRRGRRGWRRQAARVRGLARLAARHRYRVLEAVELIEQRVHDGHRHAIDLGLAVRIEQAKVVSLRVSARRKKFKRPSEPVTACCANSVTGAPTGYTRPSLSGPSHRVLGNGDVDVLAARGESRTASTSALALRDATTVQAAGSDPTHQRGEGGLNHERAALRRNAAIVLRGERTANVGASRSVIEGRDRTPGPALSSQVRSVRRR
jgi:hypothetical protein